MRSALLRRAPYYASPLKGWPEDRIGRGFGQSVVLDSPLGRPGQSAEWLGLPRASPRAKLEATPEALDADFRVSV